MYGRLSAGHSSTASSHQPADTTIATPAASSCRIRRQSAVGAATQVGQRERRADEERLQHLGQERRSRRTPRRAAASACRAFSTARIVAHAAATMQQHQQRVRVVEPEHQHGDRRQREHRAGEQPGRRPGDAPDRRAQQRHRCDAHQRLRHEHAPRREAEDPPGQRHHPQRGGRLVDGDRVAGVERAEEERRPALRRRPGRPRRRRSWPSRRRPGSTGRAPPVPTSSTASASELRPRPARAAAVGGGGRRIGWALRVAVMPCSPG